MGSGKSWWWVVFALFLLCRFAFECGEARAQTSGPYLLTSFPPSGYVDPRQDRVLDGSTIQGRNSFTFTFSQSVMSANGEPLTAENFDISFFRSGIEIANADLELVASPILAVSSGSGATYTLSVTPRYALGAWMVVCARNIVDITGVPLLPTNGPICWSNGMLPMDVTNDGVVSGPDIPAWLMQLSGNVLPPLPLTTLDFIDANRNGVVNGQDVTRASTLLNGYSTAVLWSGFAMGANPLNSLCVQNAPPLAAAGPDRNVVVGQQVTFSGAGSMDSNGTVISSHWNFGDSSTAYGETSSHSFSTIGTKTVTLTVTDNCGATHQDTAVVTVLAAPGGFRLWEVSDGSVETFVQDGTKLFMGGSFDYVGPRTGHGSIIDRVTGRIPNNVTFQHQPNELVYAAAADGQGGYYIGGSFTSVGTTPRTYLAHILANGDLDQAFNYTLNGWVVSLTVSGNSLYIGGWFSTINGNSRNCLAEINTVNGQITTWNPNVNATVQTILATSDLVYVGGYFTEVGSLPRNSVASISRSTGQVTTWNPNANALVTAIVLSGSDVVLGGEFTSLSGQTRNYLGKVNASSAVLSSWNPNPNNTVKSMVLSNTALYIGGNFTTIGGQARNRLAQVDVNTGTLAVWNPQAGGTVRAMLGTGNSLIIAGDFRWINGSALSLHYMAEINLSTGVTTTWTAHAGGPVYCLAMQGQTIYAGGDFTSITGKLRTGIAQIDMITGQATDWNLSLENNVVNVLAINGTYLYVGGSFDHPNGIPIDGFIRVDKNTGEVDTAWYPDLNGPPFAVLFSGSSVYVGGIFDQVGTNTRPNLVALDINTGEPTNWTPAPDGPVYDLFLSGNTLYVGGLFLNVAGGSRKSAAAYSLPTGTLTAWDPALNYDNPNGPDPYPEVLDIEMSGSTVYLAGEFTHAGGTARRNLVAVSSSTGALQSWNPNPSHQVIALGAGSSSLYFGGTFTQVGTTSRTYIAETPFSSSVPAVWNPVITGLNINKKVTALHVTSDKIYFGGNFEKVNGELAQGLAVVAR